MSRRNITAFVKDLGSQGLVGLIALGFILWLFCEPLRGLAANGVELPLTVRHEVSQPWVGSVRAPHLTGSGVRHVAVS